ncbi:hypothetical protein V6Z12_D01G158900 [Gossypium hirsutum]
MAVCHTQASQKEQFVTLEIPSNFPQEWSQHGYSHIHFGAARLALNYHGTTGKPIVSGIALLDSRYKKYQDACIGTVEATLSSGMAMVTLFPNFTMSLQDPNLLDALKFQIQIIGAKMVESAVTTTLHYQIVYKIQDHAFKLSNQGSEKSLLISINTREEPHCVHIITRSDGMSKIRFDHSHLKQLPTSPVFSTQMMLQPLEPDNIVPGPEAPLIQSFKSDGKPAYFFKDPNIGHSPWDINYSCEGCQDSIFKDLDEEIRRSYMNKSRKKSSHSEFYKRWMDGDVNIGPLGEDNGKFVYLVGYSAQRPKPRSSKIQDQSPPDLPQPPKEDPKNQINKGVKKHNQLQKCAQEENIVIPPEPKIPEVQMYERTSSYEQDFPPLEEFSKKEYLHAPKIPSKLQADAEGWQVKIAAAEAILNWQTENALAQNTALMKIDQKVNKIDLKEFHDWLETRRLIEEGHYNILLEFVSRFTGMLKGWWNSISQADQMQFLVLKDLSRAIRIIHTHFIGNPNDLLTLKRREFFKRRCCSYRKKDLSKHFHAMTKPFCAIGLDSSLKQAAKQKHSSLTMGEIQQETYIALKDLYNRRKVFKDYLHGDKRLDKACDDSHLKIKCGKDKSCYCPTKKKNHFRKMKKFSPIPFKKRYKWKYLKRRRSPKGVKSTRCYICNQKGHFAKSCPNNKKGVKMVQQKLQKSKIQIGEKEDIESIFSIDDEPNEQSLCAIQSIELSDSESSSSEIFMVQPKSIHSLLLNFQSLSQIPIPHVLVSIYLEKYSKPIIVIAFIDTGAAEKIMNPEALPAEWWEPYTRYFQSAAKKVFATHLRSRPIRIKSYAESHSEFLKKCKNPLWKNSEYFIKLPFKKTEDINPTKASHMGMNPEHLRLAEEEWQQSEQARGKLRLVINYQPLNYFLQDDKFPLPNRNSLFSSLAKA